MCQDTISRACADLPVLVVSPWLYAHKFVLDQDASLLGLLDQANYFNPKLWSAS
ncbi:hypothetical protein [Hymenobacter sp. AT01-02]|uniref:hypothetical protein n=1 Tax=Hymenobacter sp. AT01-02 TaxID=1571877 RepID=UPI000A56F97C|nr:hypothetical protein [Hymenobacter sp. AT01-02]